MGRSPSRDENGLKKGPWTPEEDRKLVDYIERHGHGSWRALPKLAGLNRCGKSCRLRWSNYLRPDIKRGKFSEEEEQLIINLHSVLGNKWSTIATRLPGRTDNEIKNFWNTHLRKKLLQMGIDPVTHRPRTDHHLDILANLPQLLAAANFSMNPSWDINALRTLQYPDATQVAKFQLLQNILQVLSTSPTPTPTPTMESLNLLGSMPFLHDHQLSEYLRFLNPRFEGILDNSPIGLAPYPDPIASNFPNLPEFPHQHTTNSYDDQPIAMPNSLPLVNDHNNHQFIRTPCPNIPSSYSIPALVSASPERPTLNQMGNKIINPGTDHHISNPSSTSTTFDAWGELMDDEASDSYWRDIIDQASSPQWPVSS